MLQRWRKETAREQPYNAIGTAERDWGCGGRDRGIPGQGMTGQPQPSRGDPPMLRRWQNETAKEQPYNDVGAVGVRGDRSSVRQHEGEES